MTFEEKTAKPSSTSSPAQASSTTTTAMPLNSAATMTNHTPPAYDYKKELLRFSTEIEQTLTKHFEVVSAQMESKLDSWISKQNERHVEQERTSDIFTKQLTFLIDSMKRLTNCPTPVAPKNSPSPRGAGRS